MHSELQGKYKVIHEHISRLSLGASRNRSAASQFAAGRSTEKRSWQRVPGKSKFRVQDLV